MRSRVLQQAELPPGFLTEADIEVLQQRLTGHTVLEIGSYLGRSTVAIARVAESVLAVDHHRGSAEHQAGQRYHDPALLQDGHFSTLPTFYENLRRGGVLERVSIFAGSSQQAARWLRSNTFTAAFVDAEHDYLSVLHDGRLALRCVQSGGPVLFHDHWGWAGVRGAVSELAGGRQEPELCYRGLPGQGDGAQSSIAILRVPVGT